MIRKHFTYRETITTILADSEEDISIAENAMLSARSDIEEYIHSDSFFQITYEPITVPSSSPLVVRRMAEAAIEAGVGPMAAVAASIAWAGTEAIQNHGSSFGLIDNGGDIVLFSDRELHVGIYAGKAKSSGKYAFIIPPQKEILGICTSSATVGPSVSFGIADAVVCFSRNPTKADAWATSLCNRISPDNFNEIIPKKSELSAIYAVVDNWIGQWGEVPSVVPANVDTNLITRG